jgi:hypothetical protein
MERLLHSSKSPAALQKFVNLQIAALCGAASTTKRSFTSTYVYRTTAPVNTWTACSYEWYIRVHVFGMS